MFITKNKITLSLIVFASAISLALISPIALFIIGASVVTVALASYVNHTYVIDYKYAASFIVQLVGLILVVGSFVSLFALLSNLIVF